MSQTFSILTMLIIVNWVSLHGIVLGFTMMRDEPAILDMSLDISLSTIVIWELILSLSSLWIVNWRHKVKVKVKVTWYMMDSEMSECSPVQKFFSGTHRGGKTENKNLFLSLRRCWWSSYLRKFELLQALWCFCLDRLHSGGVGGVQTSDC